jgi:hypothetical protein
MPIEQDQNVLGGTAHRMQSFEELFLLLGSGIGLILVP